MELFTRRMILREFLEGDFVSFRELEAHPETYHYESAPQNDTQTHTYLKQAQSDALQSPRTRYRFAVTICPADKVGGRVTLALMNASIREWEIGWAIHPNERGKGLAVEAAQCLLDFVFSDLGAHRVVAFSHAQNAASLRVMQKLGMWQDGLLRETRLWRGSWSDEVVFSILEREWHVFRA